MKYINMVFAPFAKLFDGCASMLSETGKQSLKRGISALFAIMIAYIIWFFLNKRVPETDQDTLKYFYTALCIMILLLTGVATIKDIIAMKNGAKVEPNKEPEANGANATEAT